MAKIKHHSFVDTINDMAIEARKRGISHLSFNSCVWEGNTMLVGQQQMLNFGTCGYLGLETHPEIIERSVQFARDYGTQFSVSRAYLTTKENYRLEELLQQIFLNRKVIAFSSTTLTHVAVIPIVVDIDDVIILDQQAHVSMQTATQLMAAKGVPVEMIRHSNIEMLEHKIKTLKSKYKRIWYMIDGVYSMFGDVAPIEAINDLMQSHEQLHLYVDDAHGMSWYGKNGCGRIYEETVKNGRTIYVSTLAKGFGTMGGTVVFPNEEWYNKVILHGGPLAYSHPIPPPMMGASIASAEIHLSGEIYALQQSLSDKLKHAETQLAATSLPVLSHPETPIFFVGTGQPNVGYNLNKKILNDGFYVNIGLFPAVPVKNTGLRFTITNHNTKEQITALVASIKKHYATALEEEGKTLNDVRKAFRLPLLNETEVRPVVPESKFNIEYKTNIEEIDKNEWNACFYGKGNFDWNSMKLLQNAFSGNAHEEENWKFHYFLVRNEKNEIIVAAPFTSGLFKDDLLSPASVSKIVEERRSENPHYLCSHMLIMGSMLSEGDHLFIDKNSNEWKEAIKAFLKDVYKVQESENLNGVILRDFEVEENGLFDIFHSEGFFPTEMPNSNIIFDLQREPDTDYFKLLSKRSKNNLRREVLKYENIFELEVKKELSDEELSLFYELYSSVGESNLDVNIFKYPEKLFFEMNLSVDWEFLLLRNKETGKISSIISAFKAGKSYFPVLIGIDYEENRQFKVYKQMMYRTVIYARARGYDQLHFGVTADIEKRKLGANQIHKKAFLYIKDQFNMEVLANISGS